MLAFNVSANHRYVQCWQVQEIVFTINAYWLTGSTEVEGNGGSIITANRTDWPQLESHHWIQETCIRSLFIRFIKPHIRLFPHVFILRFYVRARDVWPFPQFIITGSKHTPNDLVWIKRARIQFGVEEKCQMQRSGRGTGSVIFTYRELEVMNDQTDR